MSAQLVQEGKREYSAGQLTKGTLSLDEIRTLLLHWQPGESAADFGHRVQQKGILTKGTARRARDLVRIFRAWFLTPDDRPARCLKAIVAINGNRQTLRELLFLHKARNEAVLYDFTRQYFWPAAHDGALYLNTNEVESFLQKAQEQGLAAKGWSPETRTRLAQGIVKALLDAGFLHPESRYKREFISYYPADFTLAYLAYDLHLAGISDGSLVKHSDWGLFGLAREEVLARLSELGERGGLIVQHAGSVVSITWLHQNMNEVIEAYVR